MTGPFHDDVGGDAHGEGVADEGAAAGVGAEDGVLGLRLFNALAVLVVNLGDGGVESGQLGQFLQIVVHLLVADNRKNGAAGEDAVFVFLKDGLGVLVEFDGNLVVSLDGGYVYYAIHNIGRLQVAHIGIAERGEAAEAEHVLHPIQATGEGNRLFVLLALVCPQFDLGAGLGNFVVVQAHELFPVQEDDGFVRCLELGMEALVVGGGIVAFPGCPVQEPFEIAPLLLHGDFPLVEVGAVVLDVSA